MDDYPYELSDSVSVCGDETYIKILGKRHYVFFMIDAVKKIITSYSIFLNRDGLAAIYVLAQHFFSQHGICFDVKQVIGLTNKDEVSKEYRWLKQVIERLNRTFKGVYRGKNGFNFLNGQMSLWRCLLLFLISCVGIKLFLIMFLYVYRSLRRCPICRLSG